MTSLNVSAGLVIPGGHNYGLGFEVGQEQSNDFAGKTFIRWGPEEESDKQVSAVFNFQKGNEAHVNYGFSVTATLPNLQTIASTGTLVRNLKIFQPILTHMCLLSLFFPRQSSLLANFR